MEPVDLTRRTTSVLLADYAAILDELRDRGVVRTANPPAGDYAELLVKTALCGELVDPSVKGHDGVLPDGTTIQVKTRVVTSPRRPGQLQTSPFRSWSIGKVALVLLNADDYSVVQGVLLPSATARALSTPRAHVNGDVLMMTAAVLDHPEAEDITQMLNDAATSL